MESLLRVALVDAGLTEPEVNAVVRTSSRTFVARVDLAWRSERIAVEYEGDHHRTDRAQWARDLQRTAALEAEGWMVLRALHRDIRDPQQLVARIRAHSRR